MDRSSLRRLASSAGVTHGGFPAEASLGCEPTRRSRIKDAVNVASVHSGRSDSRPPPGSRGSFGMTHCAISIFLVAPKLALSLTHGGAPLARAASTPPALRTTEGCAAAVSQSVASACRSSRVLARKCSECVAVGGEISHASSNPTGMFAALTTRSWSLPNVKTLLGGSSSSSPSKDSRLTRLNLRPGVGSIGGSGNARESPASFRHATRGNVTSSPSLP
mmetsp:Transcript_5031/g.18910  ORF Transcript_5031/g.18910 Transcript_5031/m.18910 type:complete len:220 (-) Transcript_5031:1331-1990(-)